MALVLNGSTGITYPAGGTDNVAGAGVGTTDTQTLTNKTLAIIKSGSSNTPTVFQDSGGTEVGTLCRAWVRFNGAGGASISASFNVSSVTYVGAGNYTINFTNNFTDTNYSMVATAEPSGGTYYNIIGKASIGGFTRAVGSAQVCTAYVSSLGAVSTLYDSTYVNVAFFR